MNRTFRGILCLVVLTAAATVAQAQGVVTGELKKWHNVTITFTGPSTSETASPNPFRNFRLDVTFTAPSGAARVVPGYYAADGNAGESAAASGSKWRVHFAPNETGTWNYRASFRTGTDIAASTSATAGSATSFDGTSGSFTVSQTDKAAPDLRARGLLRYVGGYHLQFTETGEYFLRGGAGSPENLLGYKDFDGTIDTGGRQTADSNFLHSYTPHVTHWRTGDPTWRSGKGKGLIGALNYLSSQGVNSIYFLTYNCDGGDGRDTWPWTSPTVRDRYDVSKLDQWERVFSHADRMGIELHFITQERENESVLDGGNLGVFRKIYYRELVARFGHHLAAQWNLGEENCNTVTQRKAFAGHIRALDPYDHPIAIHTKNGDVTGTYLSIYGNGNFEAASIQGLAIYYNTWAKLVRKDSKNFGRKWATYGDEQISEIYDNLSNLNVLCRDALWGNLMGGGAGVAWYYGYQTYLTDLTTDDFTRTAPLWARTRIALELFQARLPFWEMEPSDSLVTGVTGAWVLAKPGSVYAVYLPNGGTPKLSVTSGTYEVSWYNPRLGGGLYDGAVTVVQGPATVSLGQPPFNDSTTDKSAVALVTRVTGTSTNTAPSLTIAAGISIHPGGATANVNVASVSDAQDAASALDVWTSGAPSGVTVSVSNTNGTVSARATASAGAPAGTYPVNLTVRDSGSLTTTKTFSVTVQANVAPTLGAYGSSTVAAGASAVVSPSAPPQDSNGNITSVAVSPSSLAGGVTLSVNASTGAVTVTAPTGATAGTYTVTVTVTDAGGASVSKSFQLQVTASSGDGGNTGTTALYRVNAGGGTYVCPDGDTWVSDTPYVNTGAIYSTSQAIASTDMDPLYRYERYNKTTTADLVYSFPVAAGSYRVRLHFAEIYGGAAKTGGRVFDVAVENQTVLDNYDIFADVGYLTATVKEFATSVSDGQLNVRLSRHANNPKISGIEVLGAVSDSPPTTPTTETLFRMNSGGGTYTDPSGYSWVADTPYVNTGGTYSTAQAIAGTTLDPLYKTERYNKSTTADLVYSFPVPAGSYRVRLHFAEIYSGAAKTGGRVFDVAVEDQTVLDNYDIFASAGYLTATVKEFDTSVADGQLNVRLVRQVQNPKISAIEVIALIP